MTSDIAAKNKLRIGKVIVSSVVNGPGPRFVIWFQGCRFQCPGCFNPEFWDEEGGTPVRIEEIAEQINSTPKIKGITFTGGEPLLQARDILPLAMWIKSKGLSIVCYTGYLFQDIVDGAIPYAENLLKWLDILIDGTFREEEKGSLLWRGSHNQGVHFLTERYKHLKGEALKEGMRQVELQVGRDGLTVTGMFDIEMWDRLRKKISENIPSKDLD